MPKTFMNSLSGEKSFALVVKVKLPSDTSAEQLLDDAREIHQTLLLANHQVESVVPWTNKALKQRKAAPVPL